MKNLLRQTDLNSVQIPSHSFATPAKFQHLRVVVLRHYIAAVDPKIVTLILELSVPTLLFLGLL